jgi:hypothetical protein
MIQSCTCPTVWQISPLAITAELKVYWLGCALLVVTTGVSSAAKGDPIDYVCAVDDLKVSIHVDTELLSVTEQAESGSEKAIAEYKDGEFGRVSHTGVASLIPSIHQFVRISEDAIYFGGELRGTEDGVVIDRHTGTVILPNGKAGSCSVLASAERK